MVQVMVLPVPKRPGLLRELIPAFSSVLAPTDLLMGGHPLSCADQVRPRQVVPSRARLTPSGGCGVQRQAWAAATALSPFGSLNSSPSRSPSTTVYGHASMNAPFLLAGGRGMQMPLSAALKFNKSLQTLDLHASCLSAMGCDYLLPGLQVG